MRKIIVPLIMILMLMIIGCAREETPEDALNEIKAALDRYDYEKFSARVEVRTLLDSAYDDATFELANRVKDFGAAYPDDPFFRNRGDDIVLYNELNRDEHMKFVREVVSLCFDQQLTAPHDFADDAIAGTASELRHYYSTAQSTIESVNVNDLRADIKLNVHFQSLYTQKEYDLPLELEFENVEERWRLKKIKNVGALISPFVDIAEVLWIN